MKTVAIIGGGFSGTLTAVNLARLGTEPLRVLLVNDRCPTGRGVAYGTNRPEHLLNVVARNMSAFPDLPSHFVDWLRNRADFADVPTAELRERFLPRRVYGDYLQDLLFWHVQPLAGLGRVQVEVIEDSVDDLTPDVLGLRLVLAGGDRIHADRVVLATGNGAPHDIVPPGPVHEHPAYHADPWRGWQSSLPDPSEDVLLVGTGLTMIDVFLTLDTLGWRGTTHAVSRTGLLPLPHFKGSDFPGFPPEDVDTMSLQDLTTLVERECARLRAEGRNPAVVVDKLRPFTQRIWRHFSTVEKQEFSHRLRTRWNVVRHRIPPDVAARIDAARQSGRLRIHKGSLTDAQPDGDRIRLAIEPGDGTPRLELLVGLLFNCTGPRESLRDSSEPLFRNLLARGMVRADEVDMGIEVTPDFAVVNERGEASDVLFAIGPLLKGTLWETTAVPELRAQAHQVASALLAPAAQPALDWAQETPEGLVEYYI